MTKKPTDKNDKKTEKTETVSDGDEKLQRGERHDIISPNGDSEICG